jgi:hypothetical protein
MLAKDKANRLQSSGRHPKSFGKRVLVRPREHWVEARGTGGRQHAMHRDWQPRKFLLRL